MHKGHRTLIILQNSDHFSLLELHTLDFILEILPYIHDTEGFVSPQPSFQDDDLKLAAK